jgi:hypothetical protein
MTGARAFAIAGLSLAVTGAVGTVVVRTVAPAPFISVAFGFGGAAMVGYVIQGLCWVSIGTILVFRRPENTLGRLMVLVGVGYALSQLSVSLTFAFAAEGTAEGLRLAQIAGWATVLLQLVGVFQLAIGFLFPSGHVQNRRWAWFIRLYWAFAIVFVVLSLSQPGRLQLVPALQNPFGFGPDLRGDRPIAPILAIPALIVLAGLGISMVSRYRSAGRVERGQLKWFALALGVSAIGLGILYFQAVVMDRPADPIGLTVYVFAGALVPVAIGIAILRHGLYDIDRLISRSLAYAIVTGVLAVIFTATSIGLSVILGSLADGQSLAVAASTLVVFALFGPLRRRTKIVVDRRFDRSHYDASLTVQALTARLRDDIDLERVGADVLGVVGRTFHPASSSLWLRRHETTIRRSPVTIPEREPTTVRST